MANRPAPLTEAPAELDRGAARPILRVEPLSTRLRTSNGIVPAVDDVSFELYSGETLGLVGESGSGKSMTCLSILRLLPEGVGHIAGGRVLFEDTDLVPLSEAEMRRYRGRRLAIILQDPMTSLNPGLTLGDQVAEAVSLYRGLRGRPLWSAVVNALRQMRIPAPEA